MSKNLKATTVSLENKDITERKLGGGVMASDARYRNFFESSRDAIMTLEPPSWRFTTGNPAAIEMFKAKNKDEFASCEPWKLSPEYQPDGQASDKKAKEMIAKAMREGSSFFKWTHKRISGEEFPATVLLSRIEQDENAFLLATVRDITERKNKEELILSLNEQQQVMLDASPTMIFYKDKENRNIRVNEAFAKANGLSKKEMEGKTMWDLYPQEAADHYWQDDKEVMTSGKPALNIVEEMKTPQGVLWVQTDKIPYRNSKGEIIGIIGFTTDITERKRGEEALRESEEKFQKAFRAAPAMMGITLIDEGRFVDVNEKFLSVTGYARKAIIGHTSLELKLYADCRQREQMLAQIQAQGKCKDMECELCTRTGEIRLCLLSAEVILLRGERHLLTIVNDITERKKTEDALRENENRLRFALEGTNDGLWDVQMKTGAVYLSPRGCEILGYGTAGLPDVIKKWNQLVHPDDLPATNERLQAHLAGHAPIFEVEQRLRTKSGDWKWILARGKVVIRDAQGQPLRMTGTHSDISERKEMQAKLLASEKLATMGRLIADVSHEINNPLTIIALGTQQLERMVKKQVNSIPDSEDKVRMLEKIKNGTNRCKKIVAALLVSTRPTTLDIKPADVKKLIEEALESMDDRLKSQNVKVVKAFAPRLPIIDADGHRLGQVFINIITNACDAMPAGGKLRIATRLHTPGADARGEATGQEIPASGETSPAIEIEISDTGEGIGEDDIFKIFDPFVTTKKDGKGVGLGLSISSGIVREHGGDIAVTSKKGKGATFTIRLPAKRAQAEGKHGA